MTTGITPDVGVLRQAIQQRYTELAQFPARTFHFHHGRPLADLLGYSREQIDTVPEHSIESFAGVGNPLGLGPVGAGETILDLGCGAGFDCFVAAAMVGSEGKVIGVDMTDAMLEKARTGTRQAGLKQVEFRLGLAEEVPVESGVVDVAISNGVINLCVDKRRAFLELFRVLKPGGRAYVSDIVVHRPVPDAARANVDLWTA